MSPLSVTFVPSLFSEWLIVVLLSLPHIFLIISHTSLLVSLYLVLTYLCHYLLLFSLISLQALDILCSLIKRPARDACLCMGELQAPHFVFLITL